MLTTLDSMDLIATRIRCGDKGQERGRKCCGRPPIKDQMRDDHLYRILDKDSWMNEIIRAIKGMPLDHLDKNARRRVIAERRKYYWDPPYLYRYGKDGVLRRCIPREECEEVLRNRRDMEDIMGTLELKLRYGLVDSIGPRCMKT